MGFNFFIALQTELFNNQNLQSKTFLTDSESLNAYYFYQFFLPRDV